MDGTGTAVPTWTWAIPLIASILALTGVIATGIIQYRNLNRQLRASNAVKVAEMRQKWIDSLRDCMARVSSHMMTDSKGALRDFYENFNRLLLMMNPKDRDYEHLKSSIQDFDKEPDSDVAWANFTKVCQNILKREWETCKREILRAGEKPEPDPPLWFRDPTP